MSERACEHADVVERRLWLGLFALLSVQTLATELRWLAPPMSYGMAMAWGGGLIIISYAAVPICLALLARIVRSQGSAGERVVAGVVCILATFATVMPGTVVSADSYMCYIVYLQQ